MVEASVGAVTLLNDELFVALNGLHQIHVFHIDDLQFIRCLQVNGLGAQVTQAYLPTAGAPKSNPLADFFTKFTAFTDEDSGGRSFFQ